MFVIFSFYLKKSKKEKKYKKFKLLYFALNKINSKKFSDVKCGLIIKL